ncbi:MAG: PAS domain S-box protein [Candidatus Krumholzibacteria bacterium]|nr:PAS domain S-box protein [Candidatus Krumholzibacteria bacterium]
MWILSSDPERRVREDLEDQLRAERAAFKIIAESSLGDFDLVGLCQQVLNGLLSTLSLQFGTLRLYDPDRKELKPTAISGLSTRLANRMAPCRELDDRRFTAAWVARNMKPIFAPRVRNHWVYEKYRERMDELRIRALLSYPLIGSSGDLLGVLQLVHRKPISLSENDRHFFVTVADMTATAIESKQRELKLQKSEEKTRALLSVMPDLMFVADRNGMILDFKPSKRLELLMPSEQFMGRNMDDVLPRKVAKRSRGYMEKLFETGEMQVYKFSFIVKGGRAELETRLVKTGEDQVLALVRDVTARRRAEKALMESEERYRGMIEKQGEGIAIVDASERFFFANHVAEKVFGVPEGSLKGRSVFDFVEAESREGIREETARRIQGQRSTYPLTILRQDGEKRHLQITATPWMDEQGNFSGSFIIFRDDSDRVRAEEQVEEKVEELERFYRLAVERELKMVQLKAEVNELSRKLGKEVPYRIQEEEL